MKFLKKLDVNLATTNKDDVEGLMNMLMLLATLSMSVCMEIFGRLDHEQWLLGDELKHRGAPSEPPASMTVLLEANIALSSQFIALILGLVTYLTFNLSTAREDDDSFRLWRKRSMFPLYAGYVFFVLGICVFMDANSRTVEMTFPHYCTKDLAQIFNESTGKPKNYAGCPARPVRYVQSTTVWQHQVPFTTINIVTIIAAGIGVLVSVSLINRDKKLDSIQVTRPTLVGARGGEAMDTLDSILQELGMQHFSARLSEAGLSYQVLQEACSLPLLLNTALAEAGIKSTGDRVSFIVKLSAKDKE